VTVDPTGFDEMVTVEPESIVVPDVVTIVTPTVEVADAPTATYWLAVPTVGVLFAAFAGTTDTSPNPSEATATADTFFNEIVFTIFLSFSQIKEFLLPGW
jgi:predicted membrane-bound spermidine synthase